MPITIQVVVRKARTLLSQIAESAIRNPSDKLMKKRDINLCEKRWSLVSKGGGMLFRLRITLYDSLEYWLLLYADLVAVIELARQNAETAGYDLVAFT